MFKASNPTVLVLGAGASVPYGFPSGSDLKEWIWSDDALGALVALGESEDEVRTFQQALFLSDSRSIDAFLEHRQEFKEIGKTAIATRLIFFEKMLSLFATGGSRWYQYLLDKIDCRPGTLCKGLAIVTFNYDRSLEKYLYTTLKNRFTEAFASEQMNQIRIIHVYGQLGRLPFQDAPFHHGDVRDYEPDLSRESIDKARSGIIVMSESDDDRRSLQQARAALDEAHRIYFLGFGYHPENMKRLRIRFDGPNQHGAFPRVIGGMCFDKTEEEKKRLAKTYKMELALFGQINQEIEPYLRSQASFLED